MPNTETELPATVSPATRETVEGLFRRLLHSGQLQWFPKDPKHLDMVLAVAAATLTRRRPYPEWEINNALAVWLASARGDIDHVTLRRRMVDLGFLKRRRDGSVYFLNYGRVAEVLGDPAVEIDAAAILNDILRERGVRRRAFAKPVASCG